MACPSENTLFVAELINWRVQKLVLQPRQDEEVDRNFYGAGGAVRLAALEGCSVKSTILDDERLMPRVNNLTSKNNKNRKDPTIINGSTVLI